MSGAWLLVEGSRQAAAAPEVVSSLPGCRFVASSPAAYAGLREHGLEPLCLYGYLPFEELNRIAERNQEAAARICSSLDRELEAVSGLPAGFRPFDALLFQLKSLLDALSFRQRELEEFFGSENPDALHYWPRAKKSFERLHEEMTSYSQPFAYAVFESAAAELLDAWSGPVGRSVKALEPGWRTDGRAEISPRGFGPAETLLRSLLNFNRLGGLVALGGANLGRESTVQLRLAVLSGSDEVLTFLRSAAAEPSVGIDWWTELGRSPVSLRTGRAVRLASANTRRGPWFQRPDLLQEVVSSGLAAASSDLPPPLMAVLQDRLTRFARRRVPQLADLFARVQRYIELRRPAAMLTGTTTGDAVQTVGHACRLADVPLVSFQHGGNFGYVRLPQLASSDLKAADIFCAYGAGVRRQLQGDTAAAGRPLVLDLGWPRQGRPSRSRRRRLPKSSARQPGAAGPRRPRVMYAATNLMGDRRIGPRYWYDDTAYFLHQVELITVLAGCEGLDLTVKLHFKESSENPLSRHLREAERAVRVVREMPLPEMLPEFDVIVMDWPATTLLEALTRSKPVVYVDLGWLAWYEEAQDALRREVHWISRGEGWQEEVKRALAACILSSPAGAPGEFSAAYASADYRPRLLLRVLSEWSADDS